MENEINKVFDRGIGNIYQGRPEDLSGRSPEERAVYDILDRLEISYEHMDHEPAMTMEDCRCVEEVLGVRACKNLFLRNTQKTQFYLLLMPGEKKFVTKELSRQLGIARLSFAEEAYMVQYLGVHPGSVTVMGLIHDKGNAVRLIVDRDVYNEEYMGCHPCANTSSIKIRTSDVFEKLLAFTGHEPVIVDL